jgi:hypothetical protein
MIDGEEVLNLFATFMQPQSRHRVLRLLGEAKLGKSHLLTKVLPVLARSQYQACTCAILDLRNPALGVPDILHNTCSQLNDAAFTGYRNAYQAWRNRPKIEANGLQALLSKISIQARSSEDDTRLILPDLTRAFVSDLRQFDAKPVLLLFDAVNDSTDQTRTWLMDMLLVQLSPLDHVRVVIAGRDLPDAAGSYAAACLSYELQPVVEVDAYIRFCHETGVTLAEQSIRDFAHAFNYRPGLFAEYTQSFANRSTSHGR